jgi:hypothetical protein
MGVKTATVRITRHRHIIKTARQAAVDPLLSVGLERSGRSRSSLCGQDRSLTLDRNQC